MALKNREQRSFTFFHFEKILSNTYIQNVEVVSGLGVNGQLDPVKSRLFKAVVKVTKATGHRLQPVRNFHNTHNTTVFLTTFSLKVNKERFETNQCGLLLKEKIGL